jgi:hypothetical protein
MMQVASICLAQREERLPEALETSPYTYLQIQGHEIKDRACKDAAMFHTLEIPT